LGLLIEET